MDGYRDLPYVPLSAGYYASSRYPAGYGVEGRSSYVLTAGDPLYSSYPRSALDAYAGYGAPVLYHPESRRGLNSKRRPPAQINGKRRQAPSDGLTPKKKPFKKTQKVDKFSAKGSLRKRNSEGKPPHKEQKDVDKPQKSADATLAKETEELHKLFRTGVDSGIKVVKPIAKQGAGTPGKKKTGKSAARKRKADGQKKGPPSAKKSKGKKNTTPKKKEAQKDEKPLLTPKAVKLEPVALTEEEKKDVELALELQHAACKAVIEFLGIPEKSSEPESEVEKSELVEAAGDAAQEDTPATKVQDASGEVPKPPPPSLTPEEEQELEEKGLKFFSKMFEENGDLCKLYIDKKDAGSFECLVCHSTDPTTSKKFSSVTNLVMHTSMRKQNRPEHRGYGKAICEILGWESLKPKRLVKQVKADDENTKEVEAVKDVGESEEKQNGTSDN